MALSSLVSNHLIQVILWGSMILGLGWVIRGLIWAPHIDSASLDRCPMLNFSIFL